MSHDLRSITALFQSGRAAEALAACTDLARDNPASAETANLRSYLLWHVGQLDDALAEARRACALAPTNAGMLVNLARMLMSRDDLDPVLKTLAEAQALKPDWVEPVITAAEACTKAGYFHAAAQRCREAIPRWPNEAELVWTLANALHFAGKNEQAVEVLAPISARNPTDLRLLSAIAHYSNYIPTWTREQVFEAHKKFGRALTRFHSAPSPTVTPEPLAGRRARVGIISPDLREHSVAFFVRPLLEHLDRSKVELFAYHTYASDDSMTGALAALAEHWRPIRSKNPDDIAATVRADKLDLIIELAGHTKGHSLIPLARKLATKSATYLGYPNTTGLTQINFRLVDSHTDPAGADAFATEKLVRLDPCFICFSPPTSELPSPTPDTSSSTPITFCSFNTLKKINDATIALWSAALRATPSSRLLLKSHGLSEPATQHDLLARFAHHNITPDRIQFLGQIKSTASHLAAYHQADIALDTFPYHGTTTTCEALWMGVPVVTLAGDRHASRVGVSLLTNVGLPDLIATSQDHFAQIASTLAADKPRLATLRHSLRAMVQASPLCDGPGFARRFELAVTSMIET